ERGAGARDGMDLYAVNGWDYPALCETYARAAARVRSEQVPAILHVRELTQPQGHSTSGSHERYKPKERLEWERAYDCLPQMRTWILASGLGVAAELDRIEQEALARTREAQQAAWRAFLAPLEQERDAVVARVEEMSAGS